ncbi:hypothetical protein L7I36_23840, partial [Obesumbacterium proteus]
YFGKSSVYKQFPLLVNFKPSLLLVKSSYPNCSSRLLMDFPSGDGVINSRFAAFLKESSCAVIMNKFRFFDKTNMSINTFRQEI